LRRTNGPGHTRFIHEVVLVKACTKVITVLRFPLAHIAQDEF
jgi:hypothetical protein